MTVQLQTSSTEQQLAKAQERLARALSRLEKAVSKYDKKLEHESLLREEVVKDLDTQLNLLDEFIKKNRA